MYVVSWAFKDGDFDMEANEEIVKSDEEVVIFLDTALAMIKSLESDPDTIGVVLYECHEIEIPEETK